MIRIMLLCFCILISGCANLRSWDRIGAGIRFKTVGWLESVVGLELDLWLGAERAPRIEEVRNDLPHWFNHSLLKKQIGFDQ